MVANHNQESGKALPQWTPQEIDTTLAALWQRMETATRQLTALESILKNPRYPVSGVTRGSYQAQIHTLREALAALAADARPYTAEYDRRRWSRYFLVINGNGHVHRGRNCSTCFPSTRYAWLPELSGCDETVAVAEYGEQMCTVCFPAAPTLAKQLGPSRLAREAAVKTAARAAERAAKAAQKAEKAITNPDGTVLTGQQWRIATVAAAKRELTDLVGTLHFRKFVPGSYVAEHEAEYVAARERVAVALAAKLGGTPDDHKAEALHKALKRGH